MTALPKRFLVLGATVQTARTVRRLKRSRTAVPEQWQAFPGLLAGFSATQLGRSIGIEPRIDYTAFRNRVPVRSYEQLTPFIERMKRGEPNVLWPGVCSWFALSAGTVGSTPKSLPVTESLLSHFRRAAHASLMYYTARAGGTSVFRGRHLLFDLSSTLKAVPETTDSVASCGELSAILGHQLPDWVEKHFYEPGATVARLEDEHARLEATVARTLSQDITLLAGIPNRLLSLAESVRAAAGPSAGKAPTLQSVWRNLECIIHGGVPLAPFHDELRRVAGPTVKFHEVYFASEGFVAAQDADASSGLRLMTDVGLFYEFIPWKDFDEAAPLALGTKAVPLEDVRAGIDYVLLLTTPGGLCRYVLEDVVRFISTEPPRLVYVGRTRLQLNAFNEHVSEKDLTDSLVAVCHRHGWTITHFHVAPIFASTLTGQNRGRHEWWVELQPGTTETPTGPILAAQLDAEMKTQSPDYDAKRTAAVLEAPLVRLVMPGFFEHWMRTNGRWGGQSKLPRCRSDRQIADVLTALACFTAD